MRNLLIATLWVIESFQRRVLWDGVRTFKSIHTLSTVSVVGVATWLRPGRFGIRIPVTVRNFFLDPPIPQFTGHRVFCPRGLEVRGVNWTTRLRLRLRMSGAIPLLLLYALMAWTGEDFLGVFANCEKKSLLDSSCLSVWNLAPTERIFMKFDIWEFSKKSVKKFHVSLKSNKNNG